MKQIATDQKKYPPIHFIIGPGRSGTTLLMMLLNHTKGVIATPEVKHVMSSHKLKLSLYLSL